MDEYPYNEETISGWTVEEGRDYVISTGREIGWYVGFARGTRAVALPDQIVSQSIRYNSTKGAQLYMTKYGLEHTEKTGLWKKVDKKLDLGDFNTTYIRKEITSGGDYLISYSIYFSYYNFVASVSGYGLEKDVSDDFIENLARVMLDKLKTANLEEPAKLKMELSNFQI